VFEIHVLVGVENISAVAVDEFVDGGVEPDLIGAAEEENGAIFHGSLGAKATRKKSAG
jgi:hypothetical protein